MCVETLLEIFASSNYNSKFKKQTQLADEEVTALPTKDEAKKLKVAKKMVEKRIDSTDGNA